MLIIADSYFRKLKKREKKKPIPTHKYEKLDNIKWETI